MHKERISCCELFWTSLFCDWKASTISTLKKSDFSVIINTSPFYKLRNTDPSLVCIRTRMYPWYNIYYITCILLWCCSILLYCTVLCTYCALNRHMHSSASHLGYMCMLSFANTSSENKASNTIFNENYYFCYISNIGVPTGKWITQNVHYQSPWFDNIFSLP